MGLTTYQLIRTKRKDLAKWKHEGIDAAVISHAADYIIRFVCVLDDRG